MTILPRWASGAPPNEADRTLADASLEELMSLEVTSVSRKRQLLSKSAAAVYVITQDDIRRSGVTSIPEALRMAPGIFVARLDSNKWIVSARGDIGRFANKLLVLIDGRTVYTNVYSGVYWEQNDVLLEDIDRIEVIRGPGGSMWGANAVHGVINIITKSSQQTQGMMTALQSGNEDRGLGAMRYGGRSGENLTWRTHAKVNSRSGLKLASGKDAHDDWTVGRAGARVDWQRGERDTFAFHGDAYRGNANETLFPVFGLPDPATAVPGNASFFGGYALGRWERALGDDSRAALQTYVHSENREEGLGILSNQIFDLDYQQEALLGARHALMWGAGYRLSSDSIRKGEFLRQALGPILPPSRTESLASVFLQDDIQIVPDRVVLTVGTKLQHNAYTSWEVQPNVRVLWSPTSRQNFWASLSRAVRTPSRRDAFVNMQIDVLLGAPPGIGGVLTGNPLFQSEVLVSREVGWRWQPAKSLTLDLATFFAQQKGGQVNKHRDLQFQPPGSMPFAIVPITFVNGLDKDSMGAELAAAWVVRRNWRLHGYYTWFSEGEPRYWAGVNASFLRPPDVQPAHLVHLRSSLDLRRGISLDTGWYVVAPGQENPLPGYLRGDVRIAWRTGERSEVSFGVQNLLDNRHPEYPDEYYTQRSEAKRAFYVRLNWGN